MSLQERSVKGVTRFLADERLEGDALRVHISQIGPGERSHPPHRHPGVEAFYVFEGEGTLELDDERHSLRAGDVVMFDSGRLHGLLNSGDAPMRYMVIIRP
jgi:quercetin dioxygenase-like cupin family protein